MFGVLHSCHLCEKNDVNRQMGSGFIFFSDPSPMIIEFDTADNLTPLIIWHRRQFDNKKARRTIWHQEGEEENLKPRRQGGQFDTANNLTTRRRGGQFDTKRARRTTWHLGKFDTWDRKQMWKVWPIFPVILILLYSKHIFSHCEGSQKCIFHFLHDPAIPLIDHLVTEQQQAVRSTYDRPTLPPRPILLFSCVKSVSEHI